MAEYINRNALLESIREGAGTSAQKIFAALCVSDVPTADVVEVVRCAHCQHLFKEIVVESTPYGFENEKTSFGCKRALDLTGEWVDVMLDDFCSYGERNE